MSFLYCLWILGHISRSGFTPSYRSSIPNILLKVYIVFPKGSTSCEGSSLFPFTSHFKVCHQHEFARNYNITALSISYKFQDIEMGDNKEDVNGEQSVSVNHEHNLANIDNNNGWDSWNAILDYESVCRQY